MLIVYFLKMYFVLYIDIISYYCHNVLYKLGLSLSKRSIYHHKSNME